MAAALESSLHLKRAWPPEYLKTERSPVEEALKVLNFFNRSWIKLLFFRASLKEQPEDNVVRLLKRIEDIIMDIIEDPETISKMSHDQAVGFLTIFHHLSMRRVNSGERRREIVIALENRVRTTN